ncbi:MAG TPA: sce7726 family protein [Candidatus Saccharimonadales bacterium]
MKNKKLKTDISTNDQLIRTVLKSSLEKQHLNDHPVRIIEELGVKHGSCRVDIAVINGVMHGYEIKSDLDTLQRLHEQIAAYNSVFNQMTLVVGVKHVYEAMDMIPDWWGITIAKINTNEVVTLSCIRKPENNDQQDSISIAQLLWRDEALKILEETNSIKGVSTKPRRIIYERLASILTPELLQEKVRERLCFRTNWRVDQQLPISGG